jgi:nucleoside-diphosphate-sugar epimerase
MEQYRGQYKGKKILITGGAGCVGSNLTKALIEAEAAKIIVLDDLSAAQKWNKISLPDIFSPGSEEEILIMVIFARFPDSLYVNIESDYPVTFQESLRKG